MALGTIMVNFNLIAGYPFQIGYRISIIRTDRPAKKINKVVQYSSSPHQEFFSMISPGRYTVTISRTDDAEAPSVSKKIVVSSNNTTSVNFGDLPITHATVELNVKILPKGQDVKGLNFEMLTPWGGGDYRQFRTIAITNKKDGYFVSNTKYETCPAGQYRITKTFPFNLTTTIPYPAGTAIHDKISKTKLITINTGTLKTALYVYVNQYQYGVSFHRTMLKCKKSGNSIPEFITLQNAGTAEFNLTAGNYDLSYAWNFWQPEAPYWEIMYSFSVVKNQIIVLPCWQITRNGGGITIDPIEWQSHF